MLPSQPFLNPKGGFEQTKSMTLRSGKKDLENPLMTKKARSLEEDKVVANNE